MSYDSFGSRSDRYQKRRKNTKMINTLIVIAILLIAFLIGMYVFGGDDGEEQGQTDTPNAESQDNTNEDESPNENNEEDLNEEEENMDQDESPQSDDNTDTEETNEDETNNEEEPTEPENSEEVQEVIDGEWAPYPTEQEEPHTIEFSDGSQDRTEMEMAISEAIDIPRDNLIYWWLESGGVPDRIIGYVEDTTNQEYYRVYLRWITNEGWQPQRAEVLYENLGKQKLEENSQD
ncbi:YrrS family protein [Tenuibacillus multivorans]|uniref:DUF1510 domain-containing protein n=1 Tax=Tenuibacillus multivorans TaxID=237069 RepID=A0A1G9ZJ20_9BACI|nr:YrrS family protein [Tenuibacillus multivorans]GEL77506.1 hypothetical protein TMU01_17410 [Tenuibacillus multivorans]SDN20576.1 Protein of unknown function [Tenuibacillus multivorans]